MRKPQVDEPSTPGKNYITPSGLERLKYEHRFLLTRETRGQTEGSPISLPRIWVSPVCFHILSHIFVFAPSPTCTLRTPGAQVFLILS